MTLAHKIVFSSFVLSLSFFIFVSLSYAQSNQSASGTLGVARVVAVKDANLENGTIIATTTEGAAPSDIPYDPQVLGIVARDAGIILNNNTDKGVPIISDGTVYVRVSSIQGAIKKGDLITTSAIPGVGAKAEKDGYVLGNALEDYNSSNPKETGLIAADLSLHYFNARPTVLGTLTDILKLALLPTKEGPSAIFKYIVAAIVALASFVLAFMTFGRTAAKGVEALGRNPSASRIIHLGIIFNVGIVVVIVGAGLAVSFLLLRL